MKFNLDTEKMEDIKLTFSTADYNNDLSVTIQDFCFGLASFFVDFAMKLNCDTKQADGLKEVCLSCIGRDIDAILEEGLLEPDNGEAIPEEEIIEFAERMKAAGFSDSDISSCVQLVKDTGDWGVALDYLKSFLDDADDE